MNTADSILCYANEAQAVTLAAGYCVMPDNGRILFEACRVVDEKRNANGRVTMLRARYRDGSGIVFRWNDRDGASFRALPSIGAQA